MKTLSLSLSLSFFSAPLSLFVLVSQSSICLLSTLTFTWMEYIITPLLFLYKSALILWFGHFFQSTTWDRLFTTGQFHLCALLLNWELSRTTGPSTHRHTFLPRSAEQLSVNPASFKHVNIRNNTHSLDSCVIETICKRTSLNQARAPQRLYVKCCVVWHRAHKTVYSPPRQLLHDYASTPRVMLKRKWHTDGAAFLTPNVIPR